MSGDSPILGKRKRQRSFGGCNPCRSRRLKCDQASPTCARCADARLICGYEKSLFFDSFSNTSTSFRRPLLSVEERQSMSEQLTSSMAPQLTLSNLERLDEQCESADVSHDIEISMGPFGAFKAATKPLQESPESPAGVLLGDTTFEDLLPDMCDPLTLPSLAWCPYLEDDLNTVLGRASSQDPSQRLNENMQLQKTIESTPPLESCEFLVREPSVPVSSLHCHMLGDCESFSQILKKTTSTLEISRPISPISYTRIEETRSAWILVKHYLDNVLKSFTPFIHGKTPWHVLFVPVVKNCLAGLVLGEEIDDASLAVFNGTLAVSALSLGGTDTASRWHQKSRMYRHLACKHTRAALQNASGGTKKTKYKTQLMALLTVAQLSAFDGSCSETEYFLIEAEKLIRLRGLNRSKSRKVRLLHHCYAYERIFFETTSVGGPYSKRYHRHLRATLDSCGARAYSKDSISFKLPSLDNLESDMLTIKDQVSGENDLHLQIPGEWPSSQYEEIFGLPETYLFLLSLIIRLAREKDGEIDDEQPSNLSVKSFATRAKAIERCIKQLSQPMPPANTTVEHLINAVHNALIIYFYRRIHDVDASMLQTQVADVRDALILYDHAQSGEGSASLRLIWPAFIAACEAEDNTTQTFFTSWFRAGSRRSGLQLFDITMVNIERIWREKRSGLSTQPMYLGSGVQPGDIFGEIIAQG